MIVMNSDSVPYCNPVCVKWSQEASKSGQRSQVPQLPWASLVGWGNLISPKEVPILVQLWYLPNMAMINIFLCHCLFVGQVLSTHHYEQMAILKNPTWGHRQ